MADWFFCSLSLYFTLYSNLISNGYGLFRRDYLDSQISQHFSSRTGRPATITRLIVGLLYLKHSFGLSDEEVVLRWTQNPYWQYFSG